MKNLFLKKSLFSVFLCILVLIVLQQNKADAKPAQHLNIDAVIIVGSELGPGPEGNKAGIILITDPEAIERHKKLFFDNDQLLHACGYNYEIDFWSGNRLYQSVPYNMDCGLEEFERNTEEIAALMQAYDQQFKAGTVDNTYSLKIPVTQDPLSLIQNMRQNGLHVFPFDGLNSRYPSLELIFTHQGDDSENFETNAAIETELFLKDWPENLVKPIHYALPTFYGSIYSGGEVEIDFESTVWFELGTDLDVIATAIDTDIESVKVLRMNKPEFYRLVLIITPEGGKEKLEQWLKSHPDVELF